MKRTDYISWDEYFMGVALLSAKRSKDPSTQVGCCIVDENNHIISTGYNGFPIGISDDEFPWDKGSLDSVNSKYPYVIHAEMNALLNAVTSTKNATIYVTLFPCVSCAKMLIQAGIREIVYLDDCHDNDYTITSATKKMFDAIGMKVRKLNLNKDVVKKI